MSIESIAACLHHSKATGTDKLVLLGIANHDGDGGAYPSIATLAKYANVSERSVQNSITKLIALGEVRRHINQGGSSFTPRDQRPNRYDILVGCPDDCDGTTKHKKRGEPAYNAVNSVTDRGEAERYNGVKSATNRGATDFTLTIQEPSLEPSNNLSRTYGDEVIALSNLFADLIEANGIKRPTVTDKWNQEIERLNRIDGYSWQQIEATIRWVQNDSFWRSNVLSPAKLRKQFGALQLKMKGTGGLSGWARVIAKFENEQKELGQ